MGEIPRRGNYPNKIQVGLGLEKLLHPDIALRWRPLSSNFETKVGGIWRALQPNILSRSRSQIISTISKNQGKLRKSRLSPIFSLKVDFPVVLPRKLRKVVQKHRGKSRKISIFPNICLKIREQRPPSRRNVWIEELFKSRPNFNPTRLNFCRDCFLLEISHIAAKKLETDKWPPHGSIQTQTYLSWGMRTTAVLQMLHHYLKGCTQSPSDS